MLAWLKNHPFGVKAHFDHSIVLTWAASAEAIKSLLPPCLEPDTFRDQLGFVAAAFVQTRALRPAVFPAFMGNDFYLAGYRVFARFRNAGGKRLRGLYILGSETDSGYMQKLGGLFTHYEYALSDIGCRQTGADYHITASDGIDVSVTKADELAVLPVGSPFGSWKDARRFAGPLPFTFSWNERQKKVITVQGLREHWTPVPLVVRNSRVDFVNRLALPNMQLASGFIVENIPYQWTKGKTEKWPKNEDA